MDTKEKKIVITVEKDKGINVELIGHIEKRILLRALKAIKTEYRRSVQSYYKELRMSQRASIEGDEECPEELQNETVQEKELEPIEAEEAVKPQEKQEEVSKGELNIVNENIVVEKKVLNPKPITKDSVKKETTNA